MFTKSNKQKSGFSVMNTDELFKVNGGDTYPATNYGNGIMIVDNTGTHDTIYTGPDDGQGGHCLPMGNGVQGTYDTETGTFTPNDSSSNSNTSTGSSSGNSQSSGPSGGSSSGGSSSGGK